MSGRSRIDDLFTPTELAGGPNRSLQAAIYEERKQNQGRAEEELKLLAEKLGISYEDVSEDTKPDIKELTPEHRLVLALHMQGRSQVEICRALNRSTTFVRRVLFSQQGQEIIGKWKETLELELEGLMPRVVDAIRDGLASGDKEIKLKAVDRFIKMTREGGSPTSVTVNVVNDARGRFISGLKNLVDKEEVEDVEFVEVA